jgi:hypothetical protein
MSVVFVLIVLVPLLVGASTAFVVNGGRRGALLVVSLGFLLAAAFVLAAYLRAPTDHAPSGCADCGRFGGRWWDPAAVFVVALFGVGGWLAGTLAGAAARRLLRR